MSEPWLQMVEQGFQWMERHQELTAAGLGGLFATSMGLRLLLSHQRKPSDVGYGSASWATEQEVRQAGLLHGDGVVLGQLGPNPRRLLRANKAHVLGVGPSGIGKSTLLICTLRSWMGDAIVLDLTGDLIKQTAAYRPGDVYIWEPAALNSMRLNPYDLVRWRTPFETLDLQRVAAHLTATPVNHQSDIGTYFKDIAELVLTFTPSYLWYSTYDPLADRSQGVSPRGLMTFLRNVPTDSLDKLLDQMLRMPHETVRIGAQALREETAARRRDGWNAAARWLNPWLDPVLSQATATDAENPRTAEIPVKRLQQGDTPITIYIRVTPEDISGRLQNQVRLIFEQLLMWTKDRDADAYARELLVPMDDMTELGFAAFVERMAQFDRKYGIRGAFLLQDFNQIWKHFSIYTSLLSNCGVWVIFQPNDPRNAEFLTGKLGDMTWREPSVRVTRQPFGVFGSRSRAEVSHARPLMTAEELQKMGPDRVLIFSRGLKIDATTVHYFDHPLFQGATDVADAVLGGMGTPSHGLARGGCGDPDRVSGARGGDVEPGLASVCGYGASPVLRRRCMGRMHVWVVVLIMGLLVVGIAGETFASQDLLEVGTVAEGVEGSTRTWAFRAFIVLGLLAGFMAFRYEHVGIGMLAMGFLLLGAFLGKGVDAITETVDLAEGSTLEQVAPLTSPPLFLGEEE